MTTRASIKRPAPKNLSPSARFADKTKRRLRNQRFRSPEGRSQTARRFKSLQRHAPPPRSAQGGAPRRWAFGSGGRCGRGRRIARRPASASRSGERRDGGSRTVHRRPAWLEPGRRSLGHLRGGLPGREPRRARCPPHGAHRGARRGIESPGVREHARDRLEQRRGGPLWHLRGVPRGDARARSRRARRGFAPREVRGGARRCGRREHRAGGGGRRARRARPARADAAQAPRRGRALRSRPRRRARAGVRPVLARAEGGAHLSVRRDGEQVRRAAFGSRGAGGAALEPDRRGGRAGRGRNHRRRWSEHRDFRENERDVREERSARRGDARRKDDARRSVVRDATEGFRFGRRDDPSKGFEKLDEHA